MAGEWIKVATNIHTKPEVFKLARLLDINVDKAVGHLVRFWCWADLVTVDGVVDGVEARDVDAVARVDGFCDALAQVGWLEKPVDRIGFRIPHFERHNGESAKKRALKNERQARWRATKVDGGVDVKASTKASTREEKRRDITPIVPNRFAEFWEKYPGPRKIAKAKCLQVWGAKDLDPLADKILSHVALMAVSEQWRSAGGQYIPAPLTYLNQRRWEDGAPRASERRLAV